MASFRNRASLNSMNRPARLLRHQNAPAPQLPTLWRFFRSGRCIPPPISHRQCADLLEDPFLESPARLSNTALAPRGSRIRTSRPAARSLSICSGFAYAFSLRSTGSGRPPFPSALRRCASPRSDNLTAAAGTGKPADFAHARHQGPRDGLRAAVYPDAPPSRLLDPRRLSARYWSARRGVGTK
jgi:hypothetical protein